MDFQVIYFFRTIMESLPACLTHNYFSRFTSLNAFDQSDDLYKIDDYEVEPKNKFFTALMDSNFPSSRVRLDPYVHLQIVRNVNTFHNDPDYLDFIISMNVKSLYYIKQCNMLDKHTVIPQPIVEKLFEMYDQLLQVDYIDQFDPRRSYRSNTPDAPAMYIKRQKEFYTDYFSKNVAEYGEFFKLFDSFQYDLETTAFIIFLQLCDYNADEFIEDIEHVTEFKNNRYMPKHKFDLEHPDVIFSDFRPICRIISESTVEGAIHKHMEQLLKRYAQSNPVQLQYIFKSNE